MKCAWQSFLKVIPVWMRQSVDKLGVDELQELRLRIGRPPELILKCKSIKLDRAIKQEDLQFCVNTASSFSPWAAKTIQKGFLTAHGGHRIGICGEAVISNNRICGIRSLGSICIRVARDFPGISRTAAQLDGSILIIGPPGCGKTTLLRDLIRQKSNYDIGSIAVIDERSEIFPYTEDGFCFSVGSKTDILSGTNKEQGIECVLRTMGPRIIAVDEITAKEDCAALLRAGWCGVDLIATAHASSAYDLKNREVYRPLMECKLFNTLIILGRDKSWKAERIPV